MTERFLLGLERFKNILTMEQEELHSYALGRLESYFQKEDIFELKGSYLYAKGNIPVLLCAHFDTVHFAKPTLATLLHDQEKDVMWCPDGIGGDDRCGVFSILEILEAGYLPHVVFSWDEEIGGVGATKLTQDIENRFGNVITNSFNEINFAIQFDRKGFGEAVYYYLDSPEFEEYINSFGFKTELGSYTDICEYCPEFGFAGVNISAGYINEHTTSEMIFIDEMENSIHKVMNILEDQIENSTFFPYKEKSNSWGFYQRENYFFDDISNGADTSLVEDTLIGMDEIPPEEYCQYCMLERSQTNWSHSDDPVLSKLCDDCRIVYKQEAGDVE